MPEVWPTVYPPESRIDCRDDFTRMDSTIRKAGYVPQRSGIEFRERCSSRIIPHSKYSENSNNAISSTVGRYGRTTERNDRADATVLRVEESKGLGREVAVGDERLSIQCTFNN